MSLQEWLSTREGRCPHGWVVDVQGCVDCGVAMKFRGQSIASTAHPSDRAAVDAAIRELAATRRPFSANDARKLHGKRGGVVGAAFTAAHKGGLIQPVGDEVSTDRRTHGHRIYQWIGVAA